MTIEERIQQIKNETQNRANTAQRVGEALEGLKGHTDDKASLSSTIVTNVKAFGAKGDGITNDSQAFSDAVNALTDGGTLYIPKGVYIGRFAIEKENVNVIGDNRFESILKLPDGVDAPAQTLTITGDGVTVQGIGIDGNRDNQILEGDHEQSDGIGIYSNRVTIDGCYITKAVSHGIIVWDRTTSEGPNAPTSAGIREYCTIINNYLEDTSSALETRAAIDFAFGNVRRGIISGNVIVGGDHTPRGITLHSAKECTVTGNLVYLKPVLSEEILVYGIHVHTDANDNTVADNISIVGVEGTENNSGCIGIINSHRVVCQGNICKGIDGFKPINGIRATGSDITLSQNIIREVGFYAIRVTSVNSIIKGNSIGDTSDDGIRCYGDNSIIESNIITGGKTNGVLIDAKNCSVINNHISGPTSTCIYFIEGKFANINGNRCFGSDVGISLSTVESAVISANFVIDTITEGITLIACNGVEIINNHIKDNSYRGIRLTNSDEIIVGANYIHCNSVEIDAAPFFTGGSNNILCNSNRLITASWQCILGINNSKGISVVGNSCHSAPSAADSMRRFARFEAGSDNCILTDNKIVTTMATSPRLLNLLDVSNFIVSNNIYEVPASSSDASVIEDESIDTLDDIVVYDNIFKNIDSAFRSGFSSAVKWRGNLGIITESSGDATVSTGNTFIEVNHGLSLPPELKDIKVTAKNSMGSATKFWISNADAFTFRINVDADPQSDAIFAWQAQIL